MKRWWCLYERWTNIYINIDRCLFPSMIANEKLLNIPKSTMTIFGNSIKYTQIVIGCAAVTKCIYLSTVRWDITRASDTWHFVKFTVRFSMKMTENGRRCHLNSRLFIVRWWKIRACERCSIRGFAVLKWNMLCLAEF